MTHAIETPTVIIDGRRMRSNIARMQSIADAHSLALRPHIKTHKSTTVARIQLDAGAVGFTASKATEAQHFLSPTSPSLTVAYPLVDPQRIVALIERAASADVILAVTIDSFDGLEALAEAAARCGQSVGVMIEIDVGLGRCGVPPASDEALALARAVADDRYLRLDGVLSHAGHAYAAGSREAVTRIAEEERASMIATRAALDDAGLPVATVSVGSTPTLLAAASFEGIDEIRPGNYLFLDAIQVGLGVARFDDVALTVLTTIVSRTATHYIVDAGSKTLSSDRGAHGTEGPGGFGRAFIGEVVDGGDALMVTRLSEEHGFVERRGTDLPIGARLRIVPNHACPVVNLTDRMMLDDDGDVREIVVDARGCVR